MITVIKYKSILYRPLKYNSKHIHHEQTTIIDYRDGFIYFMR
jgi:hypothetical protein